MGSAEFRLCREHLGRRLHYDTFVNELMLRRLSEISFHLSRPGLDANAVRAMADRFELQNEYAASIMDPVKYEKFKAKSEKSIKNTDENRALYLERLQGGGPFTSINEIVTSIHSLNNEIAKQNDNP